MIGAAFMLLEIICLLVIPYVIIEIFGKFLAGMLSNADLFATASGTLFVIRAGNNYNNTVENPDLSNQIHLPNTLIVGALYKDMRRADYSDYGKDVEVYAPDHFKLKSRKAYAESSGTTAASQVVCNLAIKLFSLNPDLTPVQVKQLIVDNSDKDLYEKGINIINPKNTVEVMKKRL